MNNNNKTNTLLLMVIGIATLLVAVIGATFAYFSANLQGEEDSTTIELTAGKLEIGFDDQSSSLTAKQDFFPGSDPIIVKQFSVTGTTNNTNATMPYTLYLGVTENTFTGGALKYTLIPNADQDDDSVNLVKVDTQQPIPNSSTGSFIEPGDGVYKDKKLISLGSSRFLGQSTRGDIRTHNYTLNIYFPENGDQDTDQNKVFEGFVAIIADASPETTTSTP